MRADLIAAARQVLADTGSERGLSVRGVTRGAGAAPQSFYLHFENVDQLVAALYVEEFARFQAALEGGVGVGSGVDGLRGLCRAYLAYAAAEPGSYRLLFGTEGGAHEWPDGLPGAGTLGLVTDLVEARGVGDPAVATALLWSCLHGMASLRAARPSFPWPEEARMVDALLADVVGGDGLDQATGRAARS